MASTRKEFTKNRRRTSIADTLVNQSGAIDLTGHTVTFRMVGTDGTVKIAGSAATVDDATTGKVSYAWGASDLDTPGDYTYWWIITRTSDSKTEEFPPDDEGRPLTVFGGYAVS